MTPAEWELGDSMIMEYAKKGESGGVRGEGIMRITE